MDNNKKKLTHGKVAKGRMKSSAGGAMTGKSGGFKSLFNQLRGSKTNAVKAGKKIAKSTKGKYDPTKITLKF